jgi:hypothetical protein
MATKLKISDSSKDLKAAFQGHRANMAYAATGAFRQFANNVQRQGKPDIIAGGLGQRMAKAFSVEAYPKGGAISLEPASQMDLFTRYSEIFDEGGIISPSAAKFLWIPFPEIPKGPRGRHASPKDLKIPLFFAKAKPGKRPLLLSDFFAANGSGLNFQSVGSLRRASVFTKSGKPRKKKGPLARRITVPLFFGISRVAAKARTHLRQIFFSEQAQLENYYYNKLNQK